MSVGRVNRALVVASWLVFAFAAGAAVAMSVDVGAPMVGEWMWGTLLGPFDPSLGHWYDYVLLAGLLGSIGAVAWLMARSGPGWASDFGKGGLLVLAAWGVMALMLIANVRSQGYEHFASEGWGIIIFVDPASWVLLVVGLVLAGAALTDVYRPVATGSDGS